MASEISTQGPPRVVDRSRFMKVVVVYTGDPRDIVRGVLSSTRPFLLTMILR